MVLFFGAPALSKKIAEAARIVVRLWSILFRENTTVGFGDGNGSLKRGWLLEQIECELDTGV